MKIIQGYIRETGLFYNNYRLIITYNYCIRITKNYFDNPLFCRIFRKNTDVQERNEETPFETQLQGIQDSTTETLTRSQSNYQRFELNIEDSYKRWDLPHG